MRKPALGHLGRFFCSVRLPSGSVVAGKEFRYRPAELVGVHRLSHRILCAGLVGQREKLTAFVKIDARYGNDPGIWILLTNGADDFQSASLRNEEVGHNGRVIVCPVKLDRLIGGRCLVHFVFGQKLSAG